ncbi:VOC family protein [Aquibacillus saliphilus]|uniref:VOC family protein n=1 Tax=Aquibacillus saliphilus TaxID=1909422 RepID=UPI001CF017CB|nr:VOC family protein [Aquibacillus saliphilus]
MKSNDNSSFKIKGLDHIQLAAPLDSEQKARNFFYHLLGMEEIEKPELLKQNGGVWFQCGNQELHIGIEQNFMPARKAHPAIYVTNINQLKERLNHHSIDIITDDRLPGYQRFYVNDPFGNRLEFLELI